MLYAAKTLDFRSSCREQWLPKRKLRARLEPRCANHATHKRQSYISTSKTLPFVFFKFLWELCKKHEGFFSEHTVQWLAC